MKFSYSARTPEGVLTRGALEGESPEDAARKLRSKKLTPISIVREDREKRGESLLARLSAIGTIPLRQKALFFRQLAVLVGAGIPIGAALAQTAASCACRPLARKAESMVKTVDGGQPLSRAAKNCSLAGTLERTVLAVGEETGRLAQSLELIASLCERRVKLRSKIVSALTYPAVVTAFSGGVVFVLFSFVLPRFREIFERMNLKIPLSTERIFILSAALPRVVGACALCAALFACAVAIMSRFPRTRLLAGRIVLAVPLFGAVRLRAGLSRCFRLLGVLVDCGVPLLRSLDLCAGAAGNAVIAGAMMELREAASQGGSLGEKARSIPLLRSVAAPLLAAGEQSGELAQMLGRAADWYEADLEEWVKRLSSLLEPALILASGVAAGAVVFAVFAPVLDAVRSLAL